MSHEINKIQSIIGTNNLDIYGRIVCYVGNDVKFARSFGYANRQEDIKWNNNSQHRIASVTKVFCTLAIIILVQDEEIKLSDTIDKFGLNVLFANEITIAHLLNHKSGIYNSSYDHYYRGSNHKFEQEPWNIKAMKFDDMISNIKKHSNECLKPGTKTSYSNTGFYILGYIIEKVTGIDPREFIRRRILIPLNMNDTTFHFMTAPNRVSIYQPNGKHGYSETHGKYGLNANMISTINDMHKFLLNYCSLLTPKYNTLFNKHNYFYKHDRLLSSGMIDYDNKMNNISQSIVYAKNNVFVIAFVNKPSNSRDILDEIFDVLS